MTPRSKTTVWLRAASVLAILFGLMTLKEGGTTLFGDEAARAAAGAYVPFVLWFNFVAGFFYIVASIALWQHRAWAGALSLGIALATALAFAAFGIHVLMGGAYEMRTVAAMALRSGIWLAIGMLAWRARPASAR